MNMTDAELARKSIPGVLLLGALGGILILAATPNGATPHASFSAASFPPASNATQAAVDWENVLGHDACVECHQSEVAAWKASRHATLAFSELSQGKGPEFAKAMGIEGDLTQSMCADCHATKHANGVLEGVSCESCHGASGPSDGGWFSLHKDYGEGIEDRTKESKENYESRLKKCRDQQMNRSADVYEIATNCLSCHTVPNEQLVNIGHPTSADFEMVKWSQGEVRHNFQMNMKENAESPSLWLDPHWNGEGRTSEHRKKLMYVIGQLVDLEISLRNRATASAGDYGKSVNSRLSAALRNLQRLEHIAEVKKALASVSNINDQPWNDFGANDRQIYGEAANQVADAAKDLENKFADGIPDEISVRMRRQDPIGEPYQPDTSGK